MAEDSARPARGRKKTTDSGATAAGATGRTKHAAPKPKSAKPAATKTKAKPTTRARKNVTPVAEPTREAIAEHAFLLWERGEPGHETELWLRAEAELRAA